MRLARSLRWRPRCARVAPASRRRTNRRAATLSNGRSKASARRSSAAAKPALANGGALLYGAARRLSLAPFADADLPHAAGAGAEVEAVLRRPFYALPPPPSRGLQVTIAAEGWIDVIDGGALPASEGVFRRARLRRRAQEREVRPARPPARGPDQQRQGRRHRHDRHALGVTGRIGPGARSGCPEPSRDSAGSPSDPQ